MQVRAVRTVANASLVHLLCLLQPLLWKSRGNESEKWGKARKCSEQKEGSGHSGNQTQFSSGVRDCGIPEKGDTKCRFVLVRKSLRGISCLNEGLSPRGRQYGRSGHMVSPTLRLSQLEMGWPFAPHTSDVRGALRALNKGPHGTDSFPVRLK